MKVQAVHRIGQATSGFWGQHTSSIDWCEDNYSNSQHVAEFYNTISNIPFILLGLHGAITSRSLPHWTRYVLMNMGLAFIGIGSATFHATLKWEAQVLLDELPMIFVSSLALYVLVVNDEDRNSRVRGIPRWAVKIFLVFLPISVSVAYLTYPDPVLHQVCYAIIQIISTIRVRFMHQSPRITSYPDITRNSRYLLNSGILIFLLGFLIWNLDNMFCDQISFWRTNASLGQYFGWASQGHAIWHLLTGLGANRIAAGVTYLTLSIHQPNQYRITHTLGFIPCVVRSSSAVTVDGGLNEHKKDL